MVWTSHNLNETFKRIETIERNLAEEGNTQLAYEAIEAHKSLHLFMDELRNKLDIYLKVVKMKEWVLKLSGEELVKLKNVLTYLHDLEEKHYRELETEDHIYLDVVRLQEKLPTIRADVTGESMLYCPKCDDDTMEVIQEDILGRGISKCPDCSYQRVWDVLYTIIQEG